MYALIQCQRVSNPSTTMVDVESVQFAEDFEPSEFTVPSVGKIGTAVLELEPTVQADAILIEKLSNSPKWFRVVMKTGATGGWYYGYGYLIIIDHQNGYETYYGHCSSLLVSEGESVLKGQTIARVGSTGNSTGPHLHFEIRKNGELLNPESFVN